MSLYDDLPAPATNEESKPIVANTKPENGWTPRFLQPVIRRPPVNKVKPTRSVGSVLTSSTAVVAKSEPSVTTSTPTPNSTLTTSTPLFKPLTIASKVRQPVENTSVNTVGTWSQSEYHQKKNFKKRFGNSWEDEYDPQVPNDYEKWKLERKKPRQASVGSSEEERENNELNEKSSVHHYTPPKPSPANVNLKLSGEEAYLQRAKLSQNPPVITPQQEEHSQGSGEQFAKKMLKQYGWSEGQGLGKYAQGINTPLTVERVAPGFGIILNTATNQVADPVPIPVPELKPESELERPSTVVLLTNMVGPGEVDDTLQEETAEECGKFGKVERCLIFEVNTQQVAKEEAVRIFIQFENLTSAKRAFKELNGRFFAGRKVTARYFDKNRFERLDLAPSKRELGYE